MTTCSDLIIPRNFSYGEFKGFLTVLGQAREQNHHSLKFFIPSEPAFEWQVGV